MAVNTVLKTTNNKNLNDTLSYRWDLNTDHMNWQGASDHALSDRMTLNGTSFLQQFSNHTCWAFLSTLDQDYKNGKVSTEFEHVFTNSKGDLTSVHHSVSFLKDESGQLWAFDGFLTVNDKAQANPELTKMLDQADPVTFLPNIFLMAENLESFTAEILLKDQPGSLIVITFDNLMLLNMHHGTDDLRQ